MKKKADFADILKKWEHTGEVSNARQRKIMETWLANNKIYDKDAAEERKPAPGKNRRRLLRIKPDAVLDIHGLTGEKAWLSLDRFFTNARDNGFKKLRIIHGKGNHSQGEAVLGSTVRKYIEKCPFAGESGYEKAVNGGTGATWVLIKQAGN